MAYWPISRRDNVVTAKFEIKLVGTTMNAISLARVIAVSLVRESQALGLTKHRNPCLLIPSSNGVTVSIPIIPRVLALLLFTLLFSCSGDPSVSSPAEVNDGKLPACMISPDSGYFSSVNLMKITVSCPTPGAKIRYTLDGSQPTSWSTAYADSITTLKYTNYLVVRARSYLGNDSSPWVQAILMDSLRDPIYLSRGAPLFSNSVMVGIGNLLNSGWSYFYTTNGSEPSVIADSVTKSFTDAFVINGKTTVRVKAVHGVTTYPIVFKRTFTPTPSYSGSFGTLIDTRDGQSYKTIQIGSQTWMAENLRYHPALAGASCYGDDTTICRTDGVLYNWATAMDIDISFNVHQWDGSDHNHRGICPVGSHLPSDSEWTTLQLTVQAQPEVGAANADLALLSDSGWLNNRTWQRDDLYHSVMAYTYTPGKWTYNGVDLNGFSVLPTGMIRNPGEYMLRQYYAGFWTATRAPEFLNFSYARNFYGGFRGIWRDVGNSRIEGHSVRCVLDP
jgi:uncharacterized protein (TIGR02145 family)